MLVKEHLEAKLIGYISKDSTAIIGREKPAKKKSRRSKHPRNEATPSRGRIGRLRNRTDLRFSALSPR